METVCAVAMNGAMTKDNFSRTMNSSRYTTVSVFFLFLSLKASYGLFSCLQSAPTIAFVDHCPRNKAEWDRAAERKNCHSMATRQNCTDAAKFQYHCLMNSHRNETLEVCAPIFYLQGYCPVYNIGTKEIMENYQPGYECLKFSGTEQCPSRYPSSDAYKYLQCYKTHSKDSEPLKATINAASGSETIHIPVIVVLSVISVVLFTTVIVLVIRLKKPEIPDILDNLCLKGNKEQKHPSISNNTEESHIFLSYAKETDENEQNTRKDKETDEDEQNTRKVTGKNENQTKPQKESERPARPPKTYLDKK
ncbi:uncharacterized protein LOC144627101 isoform X2 [Crassostrea virginica]